MPDIALVTCRVLPEPDPDQEPLLAACAEAGLDVELAAWDDPTVDWSRYRLAKLHSCWNYYEEPAFFRCWLDHAASLTQVLNPPALVRQNLDKRYLGDLETQGVPIVPTRFINDARELPGALAETGWQSFVVKPTISAASFMTRLFSCGHVEEAQAFTEEILETREVMVQPYLSSVESGGEVSVVHIDGQATHCILKEPRFSDGEESGSVTFQPDKAQLTASQRVLKTVPEGWLYARVDLMRDEQGEWLLSELELVEPTLFLLQHKPALDLFVTALGKF